MCPYARFQSAMFDHDTLIITYDPERGEPRGPARAQHRLQGQGPGRLRRLQHVRAGLPDRDRHPQRPAIRMHRLRRVHRRLRRGDGQDGLPARPDPLHHRARAGAQARAARRCPPRVPPPLADLSCDPGRHRDRRRGEPLPARAAQGGRDPRPRRARARRRRRRDRERLPAADHQHHRAPAALRGSASEDSRRSTSPARARSRSGPPPAASRRSGCACTPSASTSRRAHTGSSSRCARWATARQGRREIRVHRARGPPWQACPTPTSAPGTASLALDPDVRPRGWWWWRGSPPCGSRSRPRRVVAEDYQRQGLAVNRVFAREDAADAGPQRHARARARRVTVLLPGGPRRGAVRALAHATRADSSSRCAGARRGRQLPRGAAAGAAGGHWHVSIEDPKHEWRGVGGSVDRRRRPHSPSTRNTKGAERPAENQ